MSEFKHTMFTDANGQVTPDIIDYEYIFGQFRERFREIHPFFIRFNKTNHEGTEQLYQDRYVIMEIQDLLLFLNNNLINTPTAKNAIIDCQILLEMNEEKLSKLIKYAENSDSDNNTSDNTNSKMVFARDEEY